MLTHGEVSRMAEYDFFDLTGVRFDPPVKEAKEISIAVEATKAKYNVSAQEADKKAQNDDVIRFLDKTKLLFTDGSRASDAYKKAAREKREKVEEILYRQARIRFKQLNPTGNEEYQIPISLGFVSEEATKKRITLETAKRVYEKAGFLIEKEIDVASLNEKLPKYTSKTNFDGIQGKIKALRTIDKFSSSRFIGKEKVFDVYGFAAYVKGDIDRKDEYKTKPAKSLSELMKAIQAEFPKSTGDDTISLYHEIASIAATHIFKDNKSKQSYDEYLLYHLDELELLFAELKMTSPDMLRDEGLAETYIDRIAEIINNALKNDFKYVGVFPERETFVALYNQASGLITSTPYLPKRTTYYIVCPNCGMQNKFASGAEAQKHDECNYCHSKLFKVCRKCGKKNHPNAMQCSCTYVFPDSTKFNKYIRLAEEYLRKGLLDEAEESLSRAKEAAPEEKDKYLPIETQIISEQKKYDIPKKQLEAYITRKEFKLAEKYVGELIVKYPQLNISTQQELIKTVLNTCRKLFEQIKGKPRTEQVNIAMDILEQCVDYLPAIELLRGLPPLKCTGFSCTPNAENESISLKWNNQTERGISYRLLRKEGGGVSANEVDGKLLLKEHSGNSYTDNSVKPGIKYTYTLFAERNGVFSEAVSSSCSVLANVKEIRYTQMGGKLHFDWKLPENCDSVIVTKEVDGKESTISQNARNNVDDPNLEYNKQHNYYFVARYKDIGNSEKVRVSVVPTVIISEFSITSKKDKDGSYGISWNIAQNGVDLQVYVNDQLYGQTRSDLKKHKVSLTSNGFYKIGVKAFSGGAWIDSKNTIRINTYESCPFEATVEERSSNTAKGMTTKAQIEIELSDNYPSEVTGIRYFVRTKRTLSDSPPWVEEEEALRPGAASGEIDIGAYERMGKITHSQDAKSEEAYYITLYAIYLINGEKVLSEPSKKRVVRPIRADIFWSLTKKLFGEKKLSLTIKANRPFSRHPHLVLCTTDFDRQLMSANDSNAIVLMDIPEKPIDNPVATYNESFDIDYPLRKGQRLFLFEVDKIGKEEYVPRWDKGFEGKV